MKERLYYLDVARGLAILFIVLGHLSSGNNIIIKWIYSFHLTLFFIISGYLLKVKSNKQVSLQNILKSRFKTILVPYFTFSIWFILSDFVLNRFSISTLINDVIYTILLRSPSPLWFLPAFFLGELLMLLIIRVNNKYVKIGIIAMCLAIPYFFSFIECNFLILIISRSLVACAFIFIGYSMKNIIEKIKLEQAIVMLGITFILSQFNISIDLYSLRFGNMFLYLINGVLGAIGVIGIAKRINRNSYLEFCGVNTLIIMGTHHVLTRIFGHFVRENIFLCLIVLVIIMFIEYPIIKFINNHAPWMLGKFKKKEKLEIGVN